MNCEFRMITDLSTVAPKELLFNYDELKAYLSDELQAYKSMVVTTDAISDAKASRAYLNKLATSLNEYRKLVKKMLLKQYDSDFAPRVNELTAMTKEAVDHIDRQIKTYENAEKEAKLAEIREYFLEASADIEAYITWERIFNPKWENRTYDTVKCKADIDEAVQAVKEDIQVIRDMHSPYETMLLAVYARSGSMQEVLAQKTLCEKLEPAKTEDEPSDDNEPSPVLRAGDSEIEPISQESVKEVKLYTFTLEFTTTREKAFLVQSFFEQNQIQYRKVKR